MTKILPVALGSDPVRPAKTPALHGRVLFLGDSTENREAARHALDAVGIQLSTASGYRETLSRISGHTFAVVICEQQFRGGGWRDLLSRFAEMKKAPALIVLCDFLDAATWGEAINLGAHDMLLLPIVVDELQRLVSSIVGSVPGADQSAAPPVKA